MIPCDSSPRMPLRRESPGAMSGAHRISTESVSVVSVCHIIIEWLRTQGMMLLFVKPLGFVSKGDESQGKGPIRYG